MDKHVTVIVGGNGSGKTTVMECLASLTWGEQEGLTEFPLRKGAKTGSITLYEAGKKGSAASWTGRGPAKRLPRERHVFAYGRYRRVFVEDDQPMATPRVLLGELASRASTRRTATLNHPDNHLLRDLSRYLVALDFGRSIDSRLENVWKRLNGFLSALDGSLSEIRMERGKFGMVPQVVRNGIGLELRELSDGYQAMLVVIFDLMLRYPYLFSGKDPLAGEALVGIDEIDLHLHPRWQRRALAQVRELFPNTQFVVTTHSPIVVQSAIDEGLLVVRLRESKGEVVADQLGPKLARELRGAEVGSLLLEDHLFGVESRYSLEYSDIERRIDDLQGEVQRGTATDEQYRELSKDVNKLEELVTREDERRADGSTLAQMVRLQAAFVKELIEDLRKTRGG